MTRVSDDNLLLVEAGQPIDDLNAAFYHRFPYPQQPLRFDYVDEADFERVMLNQDVGSWDHELIPRHPKVWIAGCGTNQALLTALRFRKATVLGSDVSDRSLSLCKENAGALGVKNLLLQLESINTATYENAFDYIICTGVIHHNSDPQATLSRLAAALKPSGVLELMVYNRYHWALPTAFQQAIRMLAGTSDAPNFESELFTAHRLMNSLPTGENALTSYLRTFQTTTEAVLADALLQPVAYTYTLGSFLDLLANCGLHIVTYCINMYDRVGGALSWELEFKDSELQSRYDSLADLERWQITNILRADRCPYLWFYVQRNDCGTSRKTARQLCEDFMDTTFQIACTKKRYYERSEHGSFELSPKVFQYPPAIRDETLMSVVRSMDGNTPMRTTLRTLGFPMDFRAVNLLRINLTTTAFPYLIARRINGGV